ECSLDRAFLLLIFLTDPPLTDLYSLSLHDALPILPVDICSLSNFDSNSTFRFIKERWYSITLEETFKFTVNIIWYIIYIKDTRCDRKSTRLNSSHVSISYAVSCLKKKI